MQTKNVTLLAVIDEKNNRVLMIRKLRGMKGFSDAADGMAKDLFNLPGGKCMPDESFYDCAIRETIEETGITPIGAKVVGQLQFVWSDLTIVSPVFKTTQWSGKILCGDNNDECTVHWVDLDKIPYDNMWDDDKTWFPEMLNGKFFHYKVEVTDEKNTALTPLPIEEVKR